MKNNKSINSIFKKIFAITIVMVSAEGFCKTDKKNVPKKSVQTSPILKAAAKMTNQPQGLKVYSRSTNSNVRNQIANALTQMKAGQYVQASNNLLALSRRSELSAERPQIKYLLGLTMMELGMNQVAAFQFVDVIKFGDGKYTRQALEKLLVVTDKLGDETLLNYAIQRIDVNSIPNQNRDMLYFRMGEIKQKSGQYSEAMQLYAKVGAQSRYYLNALYNSGLSQAEANQTDLALNTFQKLLNSRSTANVTDTNKVAAQMAIARTLYQKKDWDGSVEAYSKIPRDHVLWHDSIFERSWAMLRGARFRSALSNFQTLHSSYYDNFYIPETLLLRSIVYLYICKYDEMEKVLTLFDKQYGPVEKSIASFLNKSASAELFFQEINKAYLIKTNEEAKQKTKISYVALRHVAEEGNVRRSFSYIRKLLEERKLMDSNPQIKSSAIGAYSLKLLVNRTKSAKALTGDMVKAHLQNMLADLKDLKEQSSLIRYEMINGKKESLKKKIAGKDLGEVQVDDQRDRSFYVQNGYEYYPFQGEYWLDEVGNYHYLGQQNCE
jgi:tetratricopeptide (TPR) repeat protein